MFHNVIKNRLLLTNIISNTFTKFDRIKQHINVGTIGHIDHGKTTLTSAITKYLSMKNKAKYIQYGKIDKAPEQKSRGITINTATLQYQTQTRHYAHVDCPGHIDYVKNMITGAAKMDAGILVVSSTDGAMPQTKQHILLCKQIGVKDIIVFLNKIDLISNDQEMVDLIEMQLKQILKKHQYENTIFIRGSAISMIQDMNQQIGLKKIQELLNVMDKTIKIQNRAINKPFMMSIENTYNIAGRGAVVSGTIEQGRLKIGDEVEFYGYGSKMKSNITGIETFNKTLDYGEAGDNVGVLIRGLTREQLHRGLIMAKPGSLTTHSIIQANIYCLKEEEGGRKNPFSSGYRPQLYYKTADTAAEIQLAEGVKIAKPGDNLIVRAKLNFPLTISTGSMFALRQGGKTIAAGLITKILPQDTVLNFGKQQKNKSTTEIKTNIDNDQNKKDQKIIENQKKGENLKGQNKIKVQSKVSSMATKNSSPSPQQQSSKTSPPKPGMKTPPPPPSKPGMKTPPPSSGIKTPPPSKPGMKIPPPPPPKKK